MKSFIKILNNFHNFSQIFLIATNLLLILASFTSNSNTLKDLKIPLSNLENYEIRDFNILLIKIIQLGQIGDIILNILKGNSFIPSLMQTFGRNMVSLFILEKETINVGIYLVLINWNLGDLIRYLFYTIKSDLFTYLKGNGFIILYPLGILGELICIENKKNRSEYNPLFTCLQIVNFTGVCYLFIQLWNKSKKSFRNKLE